MQNREDVRSMHKAHHDLLESAGASSKEAEAIVRAVMADDKLLHEDLNHEEIIDKVMGNYREGREVIESHLDEDADVDEIYRALETSTAAALEGDLYGPSFAGYETAMEGP